MMVLVVSAALVCASCGADPGPDIAAPAAEVSPDFLNRNTPAWAWTGDQLFVYGGVRPGGATAFLDDAALVDPSSRGATVVESPPGAPLGFPESVASGDQVVTYGLDCPELDAEDSVCLPGGYRILQYRLSEQTWAEVELPAEIAGIQNGVHEISGVMTDERVVLLTGDRERRDEVDYKQFWTLDTDGLQLEQIPQAPLRVDEHCIAGNMLVIAASSIRSMGRVVASGADPWPAGGGESYEGTTLAVLDLTNPGAGWRISESTPISSRDTEPQLGCGENFAVVYENIDMTLSTIDLLELENGWNESRELPGEFGYWEQPEWSGIDLIFLNSSSGLLARVDASGSVNATAETSLQYVVRFEWVGTGITGWQDGYPEVPDGPGPFRIDVDS
jgi:hypothetical protein